MPHHSKSKLGIALLLAGLMVSQSAYAGGRDSGKNSSYKTSHDDRDNKGRDDDDHGKGNGHDDHGNGNGYGHCKYDGKTVDVRFGALDDEERDLSRKIQGGGLSSQELAKMQKSLWQIKSRKHYLYQNRHKAKWHHDDDDDCDGDKPHPPSKS